MMISVKMIPYLKACFDGDLNLVKKLLDKLAKADIEGIRDESKASCIHYAARKGHVRVLEYLICIKKVNPGLQSSIGATVLHDAAANGRIETIEWILKNTNMKIDTRDINGATVLHLAAKYGQHRFIEWYFKLFSRDDATAQTINGTTPLHFACACGSLPCVIRLAASGPESINMKTKRGLIPLYLAVQGNFLKIVKALTSDFKANIFERDNDGMSLIHVACQNGCLEVLKWLVETQRFDINDRDSIGATGLHYACSNGHPNLVFYLLSRNATILCDFENGTPLHDCAANNEIECARLLLTNNCGVNVCDKSNLTAYDIAQRNGFTQLASEIRLVKQQHNPNELITRTSLNAMSISETDSADSRYIDIDKINGGELSNKNSRTSSLKSEWVSRKSKTIEPRDSSGKYYLIQEEKLIIEDLDRVLNLYDDVENGSDAGSINRKVSLIDTDTDTSSYVDLNNPMYGCNCNSSEEQQVTRQSSLSVVEYEAENPSSNRSTWFPSPPQPDDELFNINYRDSDKSDSIENARLSTNTLTSSASPTLSFKEYRPQVPIITNIPEAPQFPLNEIILKSRRTDSLKPSITASMKREDSLMAELNNRINNKMINLKKVPSIKNTIYQTETNESNIQNQQSNPDYDQEPVAVIEIPAWKKELMEKKKENNKSEESNNKKSEAGVNSKPHWLRELAIKKKENLIQKIQE